MRYDAFQTPRRSSPFVSIIGRPPIPEPTATPVRDRGQSGSPLLQPGIPVGIHAGGERVVDKAIHRARLPLAYVALQLEVTHRAAEAYRQLLHVQVGELAYAALPLAGTFPGSGNGIAQRADQPHAGYHHPPPGARRRRGHPTPGRHCPG